MGHFRNSSKGKSISLFQLHWSTIGQRLAIWPWVAPGAFFINLVDYRHALPIDPITTSYSACLGARRLVAGVGLYGTPAFTEDEFTQLGLCSRHCPRRQYNLACHWRARRWRSDGFVYKEG